MTVRFDHLVVGCRDLAEGIAAFEEGSGVRAVRGGTHPGRGTENALVSLGPDAYLEILAPQPGARLAAADEPLRRLDRLTLIEWAAAVDDIPLVRAWLESAGFLCDAARPGGRETPSGGHLGWTTLRLLEPVPGAPFFIAWDSATRHPALEAPAAGRLTRLIVSGAPRLRELIEVMKLPCATAEEAAVTVSATLATGKGALRLDSR